MTRVHREPGWARHRRNSWPVVPLRRLARLESGHTPSRQTPEYWIPEECIFPWFTLGDVWQIRDGRQKLLGATAENISAVGLANSAARLLPAGTVVLSRTASVGFSGIMPRPMATTQDFANWIPSENLDSVYLYWSFQAMTPEFERLKMGSTHKTIYMPDIARLEVVYPPMEAQREVADFLDRKTEAIDGLIAKKERLIELLQEKRQALITQAVTKGLDPTVPMKDSGIEWLGQIPAHWEIGRVGHFVDILAGFTFPSAGYVDDEPEPRLLRGINVGVGRIRWDDVVRWPASQTPELYRWKLAIGDIVVGLDRPWISSGFRIARVSSSDLPSYLLQRVARLRPRKQLDPKYLIMALSTDHFRSHVEPSSTGVSVPHISPSQIKTYRLPIPSRNEQNEIVAATKKHLTTIEKLSQRLELSIATTREYRQALITAAVTGQLDVAEKLAEEAIA